MFKKRNLWGQKSMLYTEHHVCSMLVLSFLADTKFETVKKNVWFLFSCCMKKCGIPWQLCTTSIRDGVARQSEYKQKIQESPSLAQISRMITHCAIYDLGRSWLFEGYFSSFYNCFKEKQWK